MYIVTRGSEPVGLDDKRKLLVMAELANAFREILDWMGKVWVSSSGGIDGKPCQVGDIRAWNHLFLTARGRAEKALEAIEEE
jgi:hypothetical protein